MLPNDIAPLFDTWLSKTERWLESDRDKQIECLILSYHTAPEIMDRGWAELPEVHRKHFDKAGCARYRLSDSEFLEIAYRGDTTGWKDLFANIDGICRHVIRFDSDEYLKTLAAMDRWVMTVFHLLKLGVLGDSLGGHRMNLDPRFTLSVSEYPDSDDVRFPVDQPMEGFEEFSQAIKDSADNHGFFATIDDLRIVSVAALRWLKKCRDEQPVPPANTKTESKISTEGFTPAIERLLGDLIRYANDHPSYRGNLDRVGAGDEVFRLRYFPPRETEDYLKAVDEPKRSSIREARRKHNDGVRALNSIAGRIMRLLGPYQISFPEGVSEGASVMAWALSDRLVSPCGKYQRSGVAPEYRPFEVVREKLLETLEASTKYSAMLLARDDDNTTQNSAQTQSVVETGTEFSPEACDDDLWLQLDVCITAMEKHKAGAWKLIADYKTGTVPDAKYLKNINQLAEQAGWEPFVFPVDGGLEVRRVAGGKAFCRIDRHSSSGDDVGGEAVLSALRAWREKRTGELRAQHSQHRQAGLSAKTVKGDGIMDLTVLEKAVETLNQTRVELQSKKSKPKKGRKDCEKVDDIAADKLVPYLRAGRLHLKWIEAKKPSGEKLQWFLDESESMIDQPEWEKLRSTSRRTANRYGFKVDATKQWVKSLEKEIQRRKKAGIPVPGAED